MHVSYDLYSPLKVSFPSQVKIRARSHQECLRISRCVVTIILLMASNAQIELARHNPLPPCSKRQRWCPDLTRYVLNTLKIYSTRDAVERSFSAALDMITYHPSSLYDESIEARSCLRDGYGNTSEEDKRNNLWTGNMRWNSNVTQWKRRRRGFSDERG